MIYANGVAANIPFFLVNSTDYHSGVTGQTPTITISKNGAAFASPAGSVTEIGNGWYYLSATTADLGTNGPLLTHVASGATYFNYEREDQVGPVPSNVQQVAGQTANASGAVTFPGSIGTSTYAGADTSGTTTLLTRVSQTVLFDGAGNVKANSEAVGSATVTGTEVATLTELNEMINGTPQFTATALALAPSGGGGGSSSGGANYNLYPG